MAASCRPVKRGPAEAVGPARLRAPRDAGRHLGIPPVLRRPVQLLVGILTHDDCPSIYSSDIVLKNEEVEYCTNDDK